MLSRISSTDNIYYFRHRTRRRFFAFLRFLILFFIVYEIVTVFLVSSYSVDSQSMSPLLQPGERVLVAPLVYGSRVPLTDLRLPAIHLPRRGDVVLAHPAYFRPDAWYLRAADAIVRFFTLQKVALNRDYRRTPADDLVIARVIGIPGDTVTVRDYTVYVKPKGASAYSSEHEIAQARYETRHEPLPAGWNASLPFSGNLPPITLRSHEYFLVGDNRSQSSDSREWGPVDLRSIVGQVILRYWPLRTLRLL